jgi:hypothetical protein
MHECIGSRLSDFVAILVYCERFWRDSHLTTGGRSRSSASRQMMLWLERIPRPSWNLDFRKLPLREVVRYRELVVYGGHGSWRCLSRLAGLWKMCFVKELLVCRHSILANYLLVDCWLAQRRSVVLYSKLAPSGAITTTASLIARQCVTCCLIHMCQSAHMSGRF